MKGRMSLILSACLLTLTWATTVAALEGVPYVGLGIGGGGATVDKASVSFHTLDWNPSGSIWRVFAGYSAGRYLGLEAGYVSLGKYRVDTMGGDFFEARLTGFDITPTGSVPIVGNLSALARAGLLVWQSEVGHKFTALSSGTNEKSGTALTLALGLEYGIGKHILLRGEGALHAIDKAKAGAGDNWAAVVGGRFAF